MMVEVVVAKTRKLTQTWNLEYSFLEDDWNEDEPTTTD